MLVLLLLVFFGVDGIVVYVDMLLLVLLLLILLMLIFLLLLLLSTMFVLFVIGVFSFVVVVGDDIDVIVGVVLDFVVVDIFSVSFGIAASEAMLPS